MNKLVFILALIILCSSCKREQAITEQEVINTLKKFDDGWDNKNMSDVDKVLSPHYIYFTQSGTLFNRDSVVATAGENSYTLKNVSRSEIEVTITGNTAVVSSRWKGEGAYRGTSFNEDQRCSVVLIKEDNKVSILTEHCTPIKGDNRFN
jgi:hypothetical protein